MYPVEMESMLFCKQIGISAVLSLSATGYDQGRVNTGLKLVVSYFSHISPPLKLNALFYSLVSTPKIGSVIKSQDPHNIAFSGIYS